MKRILLISACCLATIMSWACTNLMVGKDASAEGSTMLSYAADSYSLFGFLHFSPAADYPEGAVRDVIDWDTGRPQGQIPQVRHTYSVVGNMNEYQLTVGETTYGGREELWDTVGIDYGSLIYIALERCKTAREALMCVVDLIEEYGYASEGESFSFADPNEIWIMDLIGKGPGKKGAVWVATRVPDDCICAHANQARIQQLPLQGARKGKNILGAKDKKCILSKDGNWMWHKDVIALAREKGFFSGEDADFSFQAAYAPYDFVALYVCEARVWSFFRRFSDEMEQYYDFAAGNTLLQTNGKDAGKPMPLYIKPNHKVGVRELQKCMRDQYEGTPIDITKGEGAGPWDSKLRYGSLSFTIDSVKYWYPRPIATQQTGWSFVAQMRSQKSTGIFWFGVDDAASSVYVPMYSCLTRVPECFREGNGDQYTYSPTAAWWIFNEVANRVYSKYAPMMVDLRKSQDMLEDKFEAEIPAIEQEAMAISPERRSEFLTCYSLEQAALTMKTWKDLNIYLLVKYLDGQERKEMNGQFLRNPYGMPEAPNRIPCPEPYLRTIMDKLPH